MKSYRIILFAAALCGANVFGQEPDESSGDELFTAVYRVPPTFFTHSREKSHASANPFREPETTELLPRGPGPKGILENAGVLFQEGAAAIYNPANSSLVVRNTRTQHELIQAYLDNVEGDAEKQILIIHELIEVDHLDFSDWLLSNTMDHDGTDLRKAAQGWVRAGKGTILHTTTVMARSGQRAKNESVSEYIYPTEYDPPEIPNQVSLSDGTTAPITGVTPTAFETRNLGVTLEVDPVLEMDEQTVHLNLAPELVELDGETIWATDEVDELFQTRQPTFYMMKVTTQVVVQHGRYALLGTTTPRETTTEGLKNPIVLNFVRADVGSIAKWSMEEVEE